jgi:hypothetical protein
MAGFLRRAAAGAAVRGRRRSRGGGATRRGGAGAVRCVETCGAVDSVGEASDAMNRAASGRRCCLLRRASWRRSTQGRDDAV